MKGKIDEKKRKKEIHILYVTLDMGLNAEFIH